MLVFADDIDRFAHNNREFMVEESVANPNGRAEDSHNIFEVMNPSVPVTVRLLHERKSTSE